MNYNLDSLLEMFKGLMIKYGHKLAIAIVTLIIGFWLANRISSGLRKVLTRRVPESSIVPFVVSLVSILIKVMVVLSAAAKFGIETTSFIALLGGAGLAVGLALQGNLSNFASGVMILAFKPYKIGDSVIISGFTGVVREILIFNTVLQTKENRRIIIPNSSITSNPITNISGNGELRVELSFKVPRQKDTEWIKSQILDACKGFSKIHLQPEPHISVNAEDWVMTIYTVKVWCSPSDTGAVEDYLNEEVKRRICETRN
ncbi:mechanosensitive ion channel family protein [Leadbetterella byssophila]|uniref:MscS Mechanosensitive ion channel n=1 Tax=Leadbetterella byssophila (strain DSM 17132 / JCM 16389 / KACC 11308 / NBRC 106382 / 4M15) TaxID=649349 RepID=E4RZ19_LEAB4|nr:mechanosensitive ion channel domain-containing protein [Leadbetterella byssophila]ADQ18238.1 MscS Mechanosensitive ion channel [Leadbetterella byssophila DSM 17132]